MTNNEVNQFEVRTIIICIGIPASGKSTWSLKQLKKYPGKYKRTNRDSLRAMLDGDLHNWDNEKFVVKLRNTIIERSLREGFDVIVDDTNFKSNNWTEICAIAKRVGNVRVMEKNFPIDLKTALKRNDKREKRVPPEVIENFYKKYIQNKHHEDRDEFFPFPEHPTYKEHDSKKKNAIIVDVDGTIALNVSGRSPYDMTRLLEDAPNLPICNLVKEFHQKGYAIIIVSGREDCGKDDTEIWLKINEIPYEQLFMRKTGDHRKDFIIKEEIYHQYIEQEYDVRYVLDDRKQVVEIWRDKLQLCCLQVAFGDF